MTPPTGAIDRIDFHGLPAMRLTAPDGACAIVTLHGAHVVSWRPAGGDERLFLSPRSAFAAGSAIRGGIPVIFPQFAARGPLPKHGFARTREWVPDESRVGRDFATATLRLESDEATLAIWPSPFAAELTVAVGVNRLDVELEVENPGPQPLRFSAALHTYLRVDEVETVQLGGLRDTTYLDATHGDAETTDDATSLSFSAEIDRIYLDAPTDLLLTEPTRRSAIHAEGFPDVVVWNPWDTKCAALADMEPLGFRRMLCVEAAVVGRPVALDSGESWWGRQSLTAF
ncbi:MAG: D-hexose-6-phosphate mutarotase [Betaproteobacteria bacterium]|nr:D-hexose-6-phosphate mutarotase [Betaproteobacteria bacterium]